MAKSGTSHPKYRDCRVTENQAIGHVLYMERKEMKSYNRLKQSMKTFFAVGREE